MVGFLLWCILFVLCWPLALFAADFAAVSPDRNYCSRGTWITQRAFPLAGSLIARPANHLSHLYTFPVTSG